MKPTIKQAFAQEMAIAKAAYAASDYDVAFSHLERAHIIGQRYIIAHWVSHWWMLKTGVRRGDWREIFGQVLRIFAVVPGYVFGWVPKGNTGGANVSPIKPMPLPADLKDLLKDFSVARDVGKRLLLFLLIGVLVAAALFVQSVRVNAGETRVIVSKLSNKCRALNGFQGAEDIVLDEEKRVAYAVGGDRRSFRGGGPGRAKIWSIPLDRPFEADRTNIAPTHPATFKSFGADLFIDDEGGRWLFVANRGEPDHSVEVFRIQSNGDIEHSRTITASLLHNPNDLVVLGLDTILVTLDKEADAGTFAEILEGALQRPTGRVLLLDGEDQRIVADELLMANGIALSADAESVFVGELVGQSVAVYDRDGKNNALRLNRKIPVESGVDNLTVAANGTVYLGGHPKLLSLAMGYQMDENRPSPSEVIAIDPTDDSVRRVYVDDGERHGGSSVAAIDGETGRLFIGSAFGPHITVCDAEALS